MRIQCPGSRVVGRPAAQLIEAPAPRATAMPSFPLRQSRANTVDARARGDVRESLMVTARAQLLLPAASPTDVPARCVRAHVASPMKESVSSSFAHTFTNPIPNTFPASISASFTSTIGVVSPLHLGPAEQLQHTEQAHQVHHEQQPQQAAAPAASSPSAQPTTASDISDPELLDEIKACETWQDVLEIVEDEAPEISLFSTSQALSKLTALARKSPQGLFRTCTQIKATPAFTKLVLLLSAGVPRMRCAQLCNTLQALAQLRVELPEAVLAAYAQRAQQLATQLNSRDISALLHGWATMKQHPGVATLDLVCFRAKVMLEAGEMEGQGLSMFLYSLAQLDYRNRQLLQAASIALTVQLPQMTPQGVANCTWALAKLGHFSYAALTAATKAYLAAPDKFKPQEACNLLWALTQQRYHPQEVLSVMVKDLVKRSSLLHPADYAVLFSAMGTFCVHPGNQLLNELLSAMSKQLARFSAKELCAVYWGLGLLGEARQPICHQIAALLPDQYEANRMDASLLRQTFQAFLCGKLADAMDPASPEEGAAAASPKRAASVKFPPLMMDAMKRAWMLSQQAKSTQAEQEEGGQFGVVAVQGNSSPDADAADDTTGAPAARRRRPKIKQEVAKLVQMLHVPHEVSRITRDGVAVVDVALKAGQRYIALQVVMEHEHTCNTGQFLGPLQFQRQVLEMNGWEVRHVRAKDIKALDGRNKQLFMADLLRGMGIRVRGGPASGSSRPKSGSKASRVSGLDLVLNEGGPRPSRR